MRTVLAVIVCAASWHSWHGACRAQDGGFAQDLDFLKKHTPVVLLERGDVAVALAPAWQGRVMTSTVDREIGASFGWINRPVIETGFLSKAARKGKLEEHIYIFGGEERFWLGPEGGQFGLFFQPGSKFECLGIHRKTTSGPVDRQTRREDGPASGKNRDQKCVENISPGVV